MDKISDSYLLITNYWYPYNNSGTFRWLHFGEQMDFDVLTSRKPKGSFKDITIPNPEKKVIRFGKDYPAALWGLIAPFKALFRNNGYKWYIVTSPPESLLIGAYLMQLAGKKVLVDMRDAINRDRQPLKFMIPIYRFFYKRMKHVVVAWKFIDYSKPCVYHGYEIKNARNFKGYYKERLPYREYIEALKRGYMPDQSKKPEGYVAGSYHTYLHLKFPINLEVHPEIYTITPDSYVNRAKEINKILCGSI